MSRSQARLERTLITLAAARHRRVVNGLDPQQLREIEVRRRALSAVGAKDARAPR